MAGLRHGVVVESLIIEAPLAEDGAVRAGAVLVALSADRGGADRTHLVVLEVIESLFYLLVEDLVDVGELQHEVAVLAEVAGHCRAAALADSIAQEVGVVCNGLPQVIDALLAATFVVDELGVAREGFPLEGDDYLAATLQAFSLCQVVVIAAFAFQASSKLCENIREINNYFRLCEAI